MRVLLYNGPTFFVPNRVVVAAFPPAVPVAYRPSYTTPPCRHTGAVPEPITPADAPRNITSAPPTQRAPSQRNQGASHHHSSTFRRSAGLSTGTGRPAPTMRTILVVGVEFRNLQTAADLFSGNTAQTPTPPCSSRVARVHRDGVLGATSSFNVPGNHTSGGAAALHRPGAPSAARSRPRGRFSPCPLTADRLLRVARQACDRPASIKRVRGVPARARTLLRP